ncbi:hypothetical protein MCOR31_011188 [Pyricularia oryzae]|nr:hypothetical protein MCOR31_011188 [Pyricularia oryzae]KAI6474346.1 hypothetical protein MCOR17_002207 [Pyricularia oryzae]KAI6504861.1 hypothetical protein MCOR13_004569 [Pyricularia oryzae]KAI6593009.1 hypothetical protein MCOR04_003390 [Pyricularia oryzae]KAI6605135.1 hypothetical protein MCOR12_001960 [Pyricularia oryzae]
MTWLRRKGYTRLSRIPAEALNVDAMCLFRRSREMWSLDALIYMTHVKFHATDQRDKVYGILGLVKQPAREAALSTAVNPDYSHADAVETYREAARFLIETNCSMAVLTRSGLRPRQSSHFQGAPSWVPDWTDTVNREIPTFLSWVHYSNRSQSARLGYPHHYNAACGRPARMHRSEDAMVLRVDGMRVDTVSRVVRLCEGISTRQQFDSSFERSIARVCTAALTLLDLNHVSDWVEEFVRATTAEQHGLGGIAWEEIVQDGLAYLHALLSSPDTQGLYWMHLQLMQGLQQMSNGGGLADRYKAFAANYCFRRSFILTSTGRMGIGPETTDSGDVVSVILGGGVPYILRGSKDGKTFAVVGESYINGYMDGTAVLDVATQILDLL